MHASSPRALPPLLSPSARRLLALALVVIHAAILIAWLHSPPARRALAQAAPVLVRLISAEAPPEPARSQVAQRLPEAPPPPDAAPLPIPEIRLPAGPAETPPPPVERSAAAESAAPPTPPVPPATTATPQDVPLAASPAPAPAPPRTVQISAVTYLQPPVLDYPLASRRQGEEGLVQVRVLIGIDGLPRQMSVVRSSGFSRLDEAALAAVRATRFRPYTENGQALAVWVVMPLQFELQA